MPPATTQPVLEWMGAMAEARTEFAKAWEAEPGTSKGAAEAIAAMRGALDHHIANWEALGLPDTHAPPTAERALSYFASPVDGLRVVSEPYVRDGQEQEALDWLKRSFSASADLEMLNDFAVMLHAAQRFEDAMAVLTAILYAEPDRDDARENLQALTGRPAR